jgi:hypothetical protein
MRTILIAAIFMIVPAMCPAIGADGCGPGCHSAQYGGCVVDGWERGAAVWNECPAGAHPRPPCGGDYVWSKRIRACIEK